MMPSAPHMPLKACPMSSSSFSSSFSSDTSAPELPRSAWCFSIDWRTDWRGRLFCLFTCAEFSPLSGARGEPRVGTGATDSEGSEGSSAARFFSLSASSAFSLSCRSSDGASTSSAGAFGRTGTDADACMGLAAADTSAWIGSGTCPLSATGSTLFTRFLEEYTGFLPWMREKPRSLSDMVVGRRGRGGGG